MRIVATICAAIGVLIVATAAFLVAAAWQHEPKSHAESLGDAYRIAAEYVGAMDVIETAPPEVGLAFALAAERVLSGPEDVQWLIACGEYRAVRARLDSMRRDLAEIQAYRASR